MFVRLEGALYVYIESGSPSIGCSHVASSCFTVAQADTPLQRERCKFNKKNNVFWLRVLEKKGGGVLRGYDPFVLRFLVTWLCMCVIMADVVH